MKLLRVQKDRTAAATKYWVAIRRTRLSSVLDYLAEGVTKDLERVWGTEEAESIFGLVGALCLLDDARGFRAAAQGMKSRQVEIHRTCDSLILGAYQRGAVRWVESVTEIIESFHHRDNDATHFPQIALTISRQGSGLFREVRSAPYAVAAS